MASFREKWLAAVEQKNSVLCAGLDPAEYDLGRDQGLPYMVDKREWSFQYLRSVGPHAAALKINANYWKERDDMRTVEELADVAAVEFGMVVIDDSKLADVGSTNEAGIFYAKQRGFDAVTLAPFAGNMGETADQARKWDIGLISMCLMSNPEYGREKNSWVRVDLPGHFFKEDTEVIRGTTYTRKYLKLAYDAAKNGVDGIVIGAPSKHNRMTEDEIFRVRRYAGDEMLVLLLGVGAQGGEAETIWKYFDRDNVIANVGRALMFPNGSKSSPVEQADAARHYQKMLNDLRIA